MFYFISSLYISEFGDNANKITFEVVEIGLTATFNQVFDFLHYLQDENYLLFTDEFNFNITPTKSKAQPQYLLATTALTFIVPLVKTEGD